MSATKQHVTCVLDVDQFSIIHDRLFGSLRKAERMDDTDTFTFASASEVRTGVHVKVWYHYEQLPRLGLTAV